MEQDMNSVKDNLAELVNQKAQEAPQQRNRSVPLPPATLAERQNETTRTKFENKVNANFIRRTVKNDILEIKHHPKHSDNHYNVYVQEQLTRERERERERSIALYQLKKDGFRVFTNECCLEYTNEESHGTKNSFDKIRSKLAWDDEKLKEVLRK